MNPVQKQFDFFIGKILDSAHDIRVGQNTLLCRYCYATNFFWIEIANRDTSFKCNHASRLITFNHILQNRVFVACCPFSENVSS